MLVITSKSLNKDDLIKTAVARRTDLNAITLRACIDILKQIAVKEVCNGASVAFGLGYFVLKDTSQIHTRIDREKQYADTRTRERIVTFYRTRTDTVFLDGGYGAGALLFPGTPGRRKGYFPAGHAVEPAHPRQHPKSGGIKV